MSFSLLVTVSFSFVPLLQTAQDNPRRENSKVAALPRQQVGGPDGAPEILPTAEAMLESLRRYRPSNEAIKPVGSNEAQGVAKRPKLWPEGTTVVGRAGQLKFEEGWWLVSWVDDADDPPVRLLPNAALEQMVRTTDEGKLAIVLEVSGEYAVYDKTNYLLVTLAARSSRRVAPEERVSPPEAKPDAKRSGSRRPSTSHDAPVDEVLDLMNKQEPQRRVLAVGDTGGARSTDRSQRVAPWASIPDGSPISRRPGRIVRQGPWWTFVFESDSVEHPEMPMKLLPNLSVENMARAVAEEGQTGVVFLVSGEVTAFFGENFILARAALQRVDAGNLRQ